MGNSQSLDKVQTVVKEGINIYQEIKKQQDQQQQHYQQTTHYSHHESYSSSSTYHVSTDVDDDNEYSRLRQLAHEEAEKRNNFYAQSQEAYKSGNGAEAKELSNKGHHHDNLMKQYNQRAADHIFAAHMLIVKNQGRPRNEIDLHGLFIKEASEKVEEAIRRCQDHGDENLVIIVGKGLHSPNQIAKLKPAIIELVKKYNVSCQPNIPNPGCLFVEFGKGTGDLSWLDRITGKMANDQCIVM
ncbi:uncharacterized protein B0P05DRAFT_596034 [Gilbertella persicaria]|uniref:uncharacterized protein n=1 Tax=Gilbertella persicaria TaxID=101096 RepID=UPI00221EE137|nr:uncharacterized protein B0P05DRAFT_596034 [Gilbertella persicaria]KAI8082585.1 hypothetical protein B0P05DRAFT_596034 [Gilbertella persicaria]